MVRRLVNLVSLLLSAALLMTMIAPECSAQESANVVQFTAGKTAVTSNGATVLTMPVPAVFDAASKQLLLPVTSVAKLLKWSLVWDAKTGSCTLTSGKSRVVVKVGTRTAVVDAKATTMSASVLNVLGTVVGPVDILRFMGASVQVALDGRSCTATLSGAPGTAVPAASGSADPAAVTRMSRSVTYAMKKYTFEIIRIDLQGKGIRVVPVASPGGMNSGAPYATFTLAKPLAMINALPFDTTTHITTGSLGGGGIYPQVKSGYVETMGIDDHGIPFYAQGRLEVRADVTAGQITSMTTYSINSASWGGFTVYTNWYPKAIWVGSNEQLVVVDQGRIVQRVSGATFQPRLMKPGQYALHGYHAAVNHWTTDTITPLRNADSAHLHIFLGERDVSTGFFIQSAPVVLRAGQPVMGADAYADSFRMTKSGARSFLGIGGGHYLYFISSPTPMSFRTDNVGGALAQLKLFSDVISLDGGGSTTLYYKGTYIYALGRQLVTCLVVPQ